MDLVGIKKIRNFDISLSRNLTTYMDRDVLKNTTKDGIYETENLHSQLKELNLSKILPQRKLQVQMVNSIEYLRMK